MSVPVCFVHDQPDENTKLLNFVDDLLLMAWDQVPVAILNTLQKSLNLLIKKLKEFDMEVNDKSKAMWFGANDCFQLRLRLNGVELPFVKKYLGIWIVDRLKFDQRVIELI